jgi:hypothetical protein
MVGRDRIEFDSREIAALQKVVEIGADDPLPFRRARRFLLQIRDKLFVSRIFRVADIVQQFENQRSQNRVIVRVDQPRKQRTAGEIDDFRVARLETGECALVTDREHPSALHRNRRSDRRAYERADRPAAQNDVGAFPRRQGGSGAAGGERRSRADRIGHKRASAGHAHRLAEQAGHPAGIKLVAKKELVETPTTHVEAFRPSSARYGGSVVLSPVIYRRVTQECSGTWSKTAIALEKVKSNYCFDLTAYN